MKKLKFFVWKFELWVLIVKLKFLKVRNYGEFKDKAHFLLTSRGLVKVLREKAHF